VCAENYEDRWPDALPVATSDIWVAAGVSLNPGSLDARPAPLSQGCGLLLSRDDIVDL